MIPKQFTKQVRKVVVEDNNSIYQELFDTTDINTVTDEYWKEAQRLYNKLTKDERKVLLKIMKQVSLDTTSNIFGIIDGSSPLDESDVEFQLTTSEGDELSGDLQDFLLDED